MKLHPLPEAISAAVVHFPSIESAVNTVVQTMQSALSIARIELLDEVSVQVTQTIYKSVKCCPSTNETNRLQI